MSVLPETVNAVPVTLDVPGCDTGLPSGSTSAEARVPGDIQLTLLEHPGASRRRAQMGHHAHDVGRTLAFVPGVFALALSGEADRGQGPRQRLGWTVRLLAAGVLVSVAVLWATPAGAATCE